MEARHDEQPYARRAFLARSAGGLGSIALASLGLGSAPRAPEDSRWAGAARPLHIAPRARRVVWLGMSGGPSQFETFDNKPELARLDGEPMPASFTNGQPIAQLQGHSLRILGPRFPFQRWGESGQELTTLFPHLGSIADRLCIVRSMQTDQINHDPANTVMNTGTSISGRPSMGSWVNYGLGSDSEDLPGFVVLVSQGGRNPQPLAARQWHSGFLPGRFQGVQFHAHGAPVHYLERPRGVDARRQRDVIDATRALNEFRDEALDDPELATRIRQFELAYRMQTSVPELMDVSDEPAEVLELYGATPGDGSFASNCLLARRLLERGTRFVQLYHRGWDHHGDLDKHMRTCSGLCDQGAAALVQDLARRGMLEDTLVVWSGEFGRTPMAQTNKGDVGRDHHIRSFSLWMAGAGVRGGLTYGATDELGYNAVDNVVHVNDLHATMLHLLGIDHERLTVRQQGREFRLTDVGGHVVHDVLS